MIKGKFLKRLFLSLLGIYVILCMTIYFFQESLIFFPQRLDEDYTFKFDGNVEELFFNTDEGNINGLLFRTDNSKGLVFYLHGNAGNLASWGYEADLFTDLGYDVFMLDYRGYGKSGGKITSEAQLFADNQLAYNAMKTRYSEENIIILGYSIGTGMAAHIASTNQPKQLILQAPYYSLKALMKSKYPIFPTFLLRYPFATNEYLNKTRCPITIIHGEDDMVIPFEQSAKLAESCQNHINLIALSEQGHNGISDHPDYKKIITPLLSVQ